MKIVKVRCLFIVFILAFPIIIVSCTDYSLDNPSDDSTVVFVKESLEEITDISIITPNNIEVVSKEEYINDCTISFASGDDIKEYTCKIKGRGNSTWAAPKKPYAIKLNNKIQF